MGSHRSSVILGTIISVLSCSVTLPVSAQDTFTGYNRVRDEGTNVTRRQNLNFVGAGVSCADDTTNRETDCTISSAGSGDVTDVGDCDGPDCFSGTEGGNLTLIGTGPDIRWIPTGGDTFHLGAEASGSNSIAFFSNATDGVHYWEIENTHLINIGDRKNNVPAIRLRTDGTGDGEVVLPAQSVGASEVATTSFGTTTWGSGSGFTWTFDAGATDPTFTFGSDSTTLNTDLTFENSEFISNNTDSLITFGADNNNERLSVDLDSSNSAVWSSSSGIGIFTLSSMDLNLDGTNQNIRLSDDDGQLRLGASADATFEWDTNQTNDGLMINTGKGSAGASGNIIFGNSGATNYGLATTANQKVIVVSADTGTLTDYLALYHDQTNPRLDTGNGDLLFNNDLGLEDASPHLEFRDTSDNLAYLLHVDSAASPSWAQFALWRGTDAGNSAFAVSGSTPLLAFDDDNAFYLPRTASASTQCLQIAAGGLVSATGSACGSASSNTFETIAVPAGTNPVADSATDTLTFTEDTFLTLTGTAATDTIAITQVTTDIGTDGLIAANAVALTTDTTGNYAAGDAEAGAALTGDSATSFFSTGTLEVGIGGTGATSLTDGGILLGSGTGAITALGVAANGQIPIGDGTTDPVLATLTGTADEITVTNGAGTITLDIPDPLIVGKGGSGAATFTDGGLLLGSGTGAFTALGVAANGQLPIGDGTTDPVLATLTGTSNQVTVTNGAGTITLSTPQDMATTSSPTFANVLLAGTGPDLRMTPTGGDAIHFGAETAGGATVGFLSNATDGVHYLEFEDSHVVNLGSVNVPAIRLRTNGTGDSEVVLPTDAIGASELAAEAILERHVKAIDAAADEECLTYETGSGGEFEWQACGVGGGDSITVNTSAATDPDFADGDIDWTLSGGNSITATVGCTGCVDETDLAADSVGASEIIETAAVTVATLDTGQGANELFDMDQNVQTTDSPTFANVLLAGTGPDIRLTPAGGDAIHFGAEAAGGKTVGFLSNATDGVHYLEFEDSHVINLGDGKANVPAIRLRTDGTGDAELTVPNDSIALTTETSGNYVAAVTDGTGIDGSALGEGATFTPSLDLTEITCGVGLVCAAATSIAFDATELDALTWDAGSEASLTWTWNLSGTDPQLTFGSDAVTMNAEDLTVQGAGPNISLDPDSGDTFGFHVDPTISVAFLNNETDGVHYLEFEPSHVVNLGSVGVPALRLRTDGAGDQELTLPSDSVGPTELDNTAAAAYDFGGITRFELPNGTAPTADVAGAVAVDTTKGQLLVHDGTAQRVLYYEDSRCGMYENLVAVDDNMLLDNAREPMTVVATSCRTSGFTTQPTISFEDGSGNAFTGAPTCNATEGQDWTAVTAGGSLTLEEALRFDTTNTTAPVTGTQTLLCWAFTRDAQ